MTSILINELVRKYFGELGHLEGECLCVENPIKFCAYHADMAYRVLRAMQEPIRKGQLTLEHFPSNPDTEWQVTKAPQDFEGGFGNHIAWLLLPSRFQPSSEKKECDHWKFKKICTVCKELIDGEQCVPTPEQWEKFTGKTQHPPNKFDEAVKRAFEEDQIIQSPKGRPSRGIE